MTARCPNCQAWGEAHDDRLRELRRTELDRDKLERIRLELQAAMRWISSNADVPADWKNASVRLRQIRDRADEALTDAYAIFDGRA